jgi:hypothetical protein
MPTDEQLRAYADQLPDIYRAIFQAFPEVEPHRKAGYGLAFQTLAIYFKERGHPSSVEEIMVACQRLAARGFLEIKHNIFAQPTPLGERLITALTGQAAPPPTVPELPSPTW